MLDLGDKLQVLLGEFREQLPQEEGLIIRPASIVTRAIRTKRKYAHIRAASQQRLRLVPFQTPRVVEKTELKASK